MRREVKSMRAAIVAFSMLGVVFAGVVGLTPTTDTVQAQGCYMPPPTPYGVDYGTAGCSPSSGGNSSNNSQPTFSNPKS